jgi:hypothetical protein
VEFEANKNFPQGLKHTIDEIRGKYQHIQHIAVWHAMVCVPLLKLRDRPANVAPSDGLLGRDLANREDQ